MAHDNCDSCGQDYDFDKSRDVLVMFIQNPECNHVLATCPHCNSETTIFLVPEGVLAIADLHLRLRLSLGAGEDLIEQAHALWGDADWPFKGGSAHEPQTEPLPEPPRSWLYELYDTMRHFGGECGDMSRPCLWHNWPHDWPS